MSPLSATATTPEFISQALVAIDPALTEDEPQPVLPTDSSMPTDNAQLATPIEPTLPGTEAQSASVRDARLTLDEIDQMASVAGAAIWNVLGQRLVDETEEVAVWSNVVSRSFSPSHCSPHR